MAHGNVSAWLSGLGSYTQQYVQAYRFAKGDDSIDVQLSSGADELQVLPVGVSERDICTHCPVK
ncbi:hypothetical protein OSL55_28650, partial [Escherichia coli]|nr:hypothetical protein [Escherichia coli]